MKKALYEQEMGCRVFWGTHGCSLARGHEGNHFCSSGCQTGDISNADIHFFGEDYEEKKPEMNDAEKEALLNSKLMADARTLLQNERCGQDTVLMCFMEDGRIAMVTVRHEYTINIVPVSLATEFRKATGSDNGN